MCAGVTAFGLPSTSAKWRFMFGNFLTACTIAYPIRWVKEILPPRVRLRWLLMTIRLSIISLAGMARTLVAVGTSSDADMFFTTAAAAPRSTCVSSPSAGGPAGASAWRAAFAGAGSAFSRRRLPWRRGRRRRCPRWPSVRARAPVPAARSARPLAPVARCRRWTAVRWLVRGSSRLGIHANSGSTDEGSSRNLRYISSTNHSFCPNGDGELTAATRLDSFASGKRFVRRSPLIFFGPRLPAFRRLKANASAIGQTMRTALWSLWSSSSLVVRAGSTCSDAATAAAGCRTPCGRWR